MDKNLPLIIAGPCSAESETQVLETAKGVAKCGVEYFRAGIWKPRTLPCTFDGVGEIGIQWLKKIQKELGLKVGVEVANPKHLRLVVDANLDFVWIGSRTSTSPFEVQQIADSIENINMPILVKNPVIPDIHLWLGAIERMQKAGVKTVVAVHRGFYSSTSHLRNSPDWQVPIEMMRLKPEVKIICDPSHIAGDRKLVQSIAIQASKLSFDGLMIETHCLPDTAATDSKQQITFRQLATIINKFGKTVSNIDSEELLKVYRNDIDVLDSQLIEIIYQRLLVVEQIGKIKKEKKISVLQNNRFDQILKLCANKAKDKGMDIGFIKSIMEIIHQESLSRQL